MPTNEEEKNRTELAVISFGIDGDCTGRCKCLRLKRTFYGNNFLSFYSPLISLNAHALCSSLPFMAILKGYHHHYRQAGVGEWKGAHMCGIKKAFLHVSSWNVAWNAQASKEINKQWVIRDELLPSSIKCSSFQSWLPCLAPHIKENFKQHFRPGSILE